MVIEGVQYEDEKIIEVKLRCDHGFVILMVDETVISTNGCAIVEHWGLEYQLFAGPDGSAILTWKTDEGVNLGKFETNQSSWQDVPV